MVLVPKKLHQQISYGRKCEMDNMTKWPNISDFMFKGFVTTNWRKQSKTFRVGKYYWKIPSTSDFGHTNIEKLRKELYVLVSQHHVK